MIALSAALLVFAETMATLPTTRAIAVDSGGEVLITEGQLQALASNKLLRVHAEEYQIQRRILDLRIGEILMQREAKARGMTEEMLLLQEVEERVIEPTDEEVNAVLTATRPRFSVGDEMAITAIADGMRKPIRSEAKGVSA